VDTIIVRAFHNSSDRPLFPGLPVSAPGVYFATGGAPVAADVMATVVQAARARGLRVFGWMNTRKCDWLIDSHPEWLESQYDPDLRRSVPSRSLSLFIPEVRQALRRVFRDLAATGVDGILFQDDLVMRWNEGFSGPAAQAFLDATGKVVHPDDLFVLPAPRGKVPASRPLFREWCAWKSRVLLQCLGELAAEARRARPGLLIAANVYYESLLKPEQGLAWYAQDAAALAGAADYLALMSYHRQITAELSLDGGRLRDLLAEAVNRARSLAIDEARIIFKIQTTDWDTGQPIPEAEWGEVWRGFRNAGGFSLAVLQH
jgi:biofilm PGA synthesis lipoprotein PgaB